MKKRQSEKGDMRRDWHSPTEYFGIFGLLYMLDLLTDPASIIIHLNRHLLPCCSLGPTRWRRTTTSGSVAHLCCLPPLLGFPQWP